LYFKMSKYQNRSKSSLSGKVLNTLGIPAF
jgi:hypothetical protein